MTVNIGEVAKTKDFNGLLTANSFKQYQKTQACPSPTFGYALVETYPPISETTYNDIMIHNDGMNHLEGPYPLHYDNMRGEFVAMAIDEAELPPVQEGRYTYKLYVTSYPG